jgi:hypothetical protein
MMARAIPTFNYAERKARVHVERLTQSYGDTRQANGHAMVRYKEFYVRPHFGEMKSRLLVPFVSASLLALVPSLALRAQAAPARPLPTESGLYLSAATYSAGTLEHAIDCRTAEHVIDRHTFLGKPYVDVVHEGAHYRHNKSDIFGYRDCKSHDVRFFNGTEYDIAEPGPIFIYTSERTVPDVKGMKRVTDFSFSQTPASPVFPLTKANLAREYPDAHQFHHLIDMNGSSDAALAAYDSPAKTFKINALYRQSH